MDPSKNPARKIRKLSESLQNVQYGGVKKSNCTSFEWKELLKELHEYQDKSYLDWYTLEEKKGDYVQLYF